MLFVFFSLSFSLKPIYLIPGFTGGALYATITKPKQYPECPTLRHYQFFPINKSFLQQYPKCLGNLFSTIYDSQHNRISSLPGIHIESDSFGNVSSFASLAKVVDHLVSQGYVVNETLFGVPYDWVHYYPGTIEIFTKLKSHIESLFGQRGEKVILFGHSMGSHLVRLFFTNFTDSAWTDKFIDRVILNAPAFYGCSDLVERVITGILDDEGEANPGIAYSIRHMPSVFLLFENFNINREKIVFVSDHRDGVHPYETHKYLHQVNLLDDLSMKIFSVIQPSLFEKPSEIPVKTLLFYNSGLPTPVAFNETTLLRINGNGDGFCESDIIEKLCGQWKHTQCVNWKSNDQRFNHVKMLSTREELNMISKFISDKEDL